ncbi:hypothetical protein [Anoxybacteroides tepidamans]|uniref:hypothetical protein n=1 Tax=Anoxybacteroides tepidamans TaxID=265948 RepID=UPI000485D28F|nr:hypothetical protein [Anoxybacillus tepidamans]
MENKMEEMIRQLQQLNEMLMEDLIRKNLQRQMNKNVQNVMEESSEILEEVSNEVEADETD